MSAMILEEIKQVGIFQSQKEIIMKIETVCKGCVFESNCDGRFMKDAQCWRRIKPLGIINKKKDESNNAKSS